MNLGEILSDNFNFDIIVASVVLLGVTITRLFFGNKNKLSKVLLSVFLFSFFIFFNLAFITDVFSSLPRMPLYIVMGICLVLALSINLVFIFKCSNLFDRKSLIFILVSVLVGAAIYISQILLGFLDTPLWDFIDAAIMLAILIFLNNTSVSYLIKETRK